MKELPTDNTRLVLEGDFPGLAPEMMFACWTDPELLCRWWAQSAEIEPQLGGTYHLSWPEMRWHLRGELTEFALGTRMAFTWEWDHEPDTPAKEVRISFEPLPGRGTRLRIEHGPYTDAPYDQEQRKLQCEGWLHFTSRLRALARGEA